MWLLHWLLPAAEHRLRLPRSFQLPTSVDSRLGLSPGALSFQEKKSSKRACLAQGVAFSTDSASELGSRCVAAAAFQCVELAKLLANTTPARRRGLRSLR